MKQLPKINYIKEKASKISKKSPIVIITPVNRYLGFSAPIPASEQLKKLADLWNVPLEVRDPQRLVIRSTPNKKIEVCDENGPLSGSVFFGFGHDPLDRSMVKYIIIALEKAGKKVINGERSLTYADDKALMAIAFANSKLPIPNSVISGARATIDQILLNLDIEENKQKIIMEKPTGFAAGGIGVRPIPASREYILPAIWSSRSDNKPKVLQNDSENTPIEIPRKVIRAYVVGGNFAGAYITSARGFVNCAGLAKEKFEAFNYLPTLVQQKIFIEAAKAVGATGFCRIDASGGNKFEIYEVNPLARIDAEKYGLNIKEYLLWYAVELALQK